MATSSDWKKKRFEDTLSEMDSKYGSKKEEPKSTKPSSSAGNTGSTGTKITNNSTKSTANAKKVQRFEETYKEMESRYNKGASVDGTYINTFLKDAQSFLNRSASKVNGLNWSSATSGSGYDSWEKEYASMKEKEENIRSYLRQNKSKMDSSTYKELSSLLDTFHWNSVDTKVAFNNAKKHYSQWKTEDEYNKWKKDTEEYEALKNFDTKKGEAEIEHLNKILDEYKFHTRWMTDENGQARAEYIRQNYGDEQGIKALIAEKKATMNRAKHIQEGITLAGVIDNDDFKENSGYTSTKADGAWKKLTSQFGMGYDDLTYEYINGEESGMRQEIINKAVSYDADTEKFFVYDHMTEDQISTYNYYYAKDGKEAAEKYLNSIQETLNYQAATQRYEKMEGKTALEMLFGIEAGVDQFQSGIKNLFNTEDDYIAQSSTQMMSGMVREDLADNGFKLPDWLGGASIAQAGYDAITTTANMVPSIMTSTVMNFVAPGSGAVVGTAMMGASAAGNAYQEMLNLGYDKSQARAYSTLVGASEAGLQYLLGGIGSLGGKLSGNALTKMLNGIDNAFLRTALKLGGNMLSEGLEEGLQEVLTPWFQNLIMNTDEDINWSEVAYSTLLGALTAGFMEGPTTIGDAVSIRNTGKQLQNADISATRLAEIGKTFSADTVAYQLAGRVDENTGAYTMGRLFNEIGATLSEQNVTEITNALVAKGMDQTTAKKNAEALAYVVEGGQLTDTQIAVIEGNEVLAEVARTTLIDANTTWNQRSNALKALADEMTSPKASRMNPAKQSQEKAPATDTVDTQNNEAVQSLSEAETVDTSPAKVQTISSIENGQVTVKLEDGTEINVKEADLSVDDGVRIETIAKLEGISATDANFILNTLRTNTSASAQMDSLGAREAYKYGFYGFSDEHMTTHGVFSNSLTESQRKAIYETGRSARQRQVDSKNSTVKAKTQLSKEKSTGKVHFEGDRSTLKERQRASLTAMEKIADALGVQIYVFESELNERGQRVGANGWYDPKDHSIHIDLHAGSKGEGTMLFTAAHELTHFIRQWSPAKFKVLADFLMQEYGKKGVNVDALVREQINKAKRNRPDYNMTYDEAYEEVVADSMEMMLADGKVMEKLAKLKAQDKSLWQKIKDFISELAAKIRAVYEGMSPDSVEGRHVAEMVDAIERLQDLFAEGLVDASENFQSAMENVVEANAEAVAENEIITDGAVVTDGDGKKYSIRSMKQDIAEGQMFEDLKTYCGWTQKQVNELRNNLADLVEYMTPYRDILDMNETYGREGRRFSPYKPNSDPLYKISMDFSTLCSKRLLTQYVIENLQLRENRPMSAEEQMAIRDMLNEYRKVEKGLQVACAMCYVEAARLKSPKQITKWMEDPGTQMKNYFADKNPEFANFIKEKQADFKESRGYDRNATKKDMSPKDVRELNKIRPRLRSQYQLSPEEAKIIERAKSLPGSTYLTAGNLASLSETDPTIYAAYTAFVRTATRSKSLETDEPYYYGDSRRDNGNGIIVSDSFIEAVNRENGMRFSSWSDWRIQHLLDYIAAVIDNSVRGAAMHGYTKFGEEVRVLGKTGMMFNMSGVAGTQTGLNEDGSLSFSPTESIDVNEAIQLREEFPDTAGLQCIGVGDDHITALLRSDIIDYVIPYHVSGLNAGLRAMANIHGWKDYTSTQHAAIDKSIKFENAVDQEHWHEEPVYSEFFVGYDTGMTGIEDMRASADRYVQMCKDRGLKPKFEQFVNEDNYWKLLIDRKMVNQKTGKLIQQKPVTPTFDFDTVKSVVDQFVQNYDSGLEARALNHIVENWDSIPKRIRDLKKQGSTKAKKASKAVDTLANQTLAAQPLEEIKRSDRDSDGNQLSKEQQNFFKDSKVRDDNGNLIPMYHGTNTPDFTVFDPQKSDDQISLFFTSDPDVANTYTQLQDKGRDIDPYNLITKDSSAEQFNKAQERVGGGLRVVKITPEWIHEMKAKTEKSATRLFGVANKYADLLAYNNSTGVFDYDIARIREITDKGVDKLKADDINKLRKAMGDAQQHSFFAKDHKGAEKEIRRTYSDNFKLFDEVWNYKTAASTPDSAIGQYTYTETNSSVPFMVDRNLDFLGQIIPGTEREMVAKALDRMNWVEEHHLGNRYKVYLNITNPYIIDAGVSYSGKMDLVSLERSTFGEGWRVSFENAEHDVVKHMTTTEFNAFIESAFDANTTAKIKAQIEADNEAYRKEWGDDFYEDMDVGHDIQLRNVNMNYTEAGNWNTLNFNGDENAKTRDVTAWAKANGYDGVIFKNMKDAGGYAFMKGRGGSTVVTAFSSEQVKSVDNKKPTTDPDIRYSIREFDSSPEKVEQNTTDLAKMSPIYAVPESKLERTGKRPTDIFAEYFDSWGNNLYSDELGDIALKKSSIKSEIRHGITAEKIASIEAIPSVIKEGKVIFAGTKTGSDVQRIVVCAPITIGKNSYYMGVMLQRDTQNQRLYLHNVAIEKEASDISQADLLTTGADENNEYLFITNILQNALAVKYKMQGGKIRWSDRDSESVSNRSLLANAFEGVAQNDIERQKIQEYKGKISLIESEERKLQDLNQQIKDLSFSKGPKDTKAIRDLQFEAKQTANRISTYDKQLLRLEASKPLQDVLTREKKMAYQRAEKKGKDALEAYREKTMKTQRELIEKWQDSRKKGIEGRQKTAMRHKIKDVVNELNQYLLRGTKDRHVPIELQKAVAEALDAVNMDTVGADERIAKLEAELLKAKTPEKIQEISRKIDHVREMGDRMNGRLKKLKDAYDQFVNSDDPMIADSHDEVISNKLQSVIESVGDTPLRDMTVTQLEDVYDMYRMVLTTIRNTNKAFKAKKSESISVIAGQVMMEVEKVGGKKKLSLKGTEGIKSFFWNNLKPVYSFEHIGSDHFTEVFNNVRAGEDVWAVDVTEAREFYLDKSKKHGYDSWDFKKRYKFTSASGMDFELDLEQIMSLYAYSKREQAADHLKRGGIVIDETTEITVKNKLGIPVKFNPTEATAYNISDATLAEIISKLTNDQKDFVDVMQDYLSTVMGAKGNEVSLKMYGVKLFKEKFYFPLKSAQQFMAKAKEQQKGEVKIKNSGFSKETVQKASNPIVLTPFMNVWADHVNEMSMYHAFVLPMEDFYRVYNYKTPTSDTMATESVEMFIQNAYGKGATQYIDQLLKDLNGGARTDHTTGIINKMMGLFKKGAVFASLSVVVQQPSAIARAAALVDTKYFIGPKVDHKRHKALWDEVKQYAPVAVIKEMGYFDTNMGKSTQDFILGKEYSGFKDKMNALFTDSDYRDEALSKAPALADEIAWCGIWEAVKRETKAKYPGLDTKAEPFLKLCGSRFTEVIVKTQVYDSVLSRSGNMRSKDTGMKMATAFMAEPTTSINMIADALLQGKRGNWKYARGAIGAVIASQILNSILVSFVYAGRDDDEDETYWEKYIGTLTGQTLDSLNPASYIPFIKDMISIFKGYDVERSDMAVISDLWKAVENLKKDNVSPYRKVEGFAGSIAQIFGLPVKNIMRDVRGIYQTINSFVNGQQTTKAGIGYAVKSALPAWAGGGDVSKDEQLYEAILSGDQTQIARVKGRYTDEKAVKTAMRSAVKDHFLAGDIDSETALQYLVSYCGDDEDEAFWKVEEWTHNQKTEDAFSKYNEFYGAVQTGKDLKAIIKKYTDNGVTESTLKSQISEHFKKEYIEMSTSERASIKGYLLNAMTLLGDDREDAEKRISSWEFEANSGFDYENRRELYLKGEITGDQVRDAVMTFGGKTEEEADKEVERLLFEAEYGFAYSDRADAYKSGEISAEELKHILMTAGGKTAEEADLQVQAYDWEAEGYEDVTSAAVREYAEHCASANVPKDVYLHIRSFSNNTSNDVDANGKTIYYSAMKKIMAEINAQYGLTNAQKDALARSMGWAEKNIQKYKLW